MRFGDDDYEGCVLSVLQSMIKSDPANLEIIIDYVQSKCPDAGENVSSNIRPGRRIIFTPEVFEIPDGILDAKLVSVMMPFDAAYTSVYDAIKKATEDVGFKCQRADDIWKHSVVMQDVFGLIFCSFIVICDFSERNPNVFYEAGIAHTLGKHVIPITQADDDIPFDLRHVPMELPSANAAPLMCAGLTTFNALRNSGARPGDLVAVLGVACPARYRTADRIIPRWVGAGFHSIIVPATRRKVLH